MGFWERGQFQDSDSLSANQSQVCRKALWPSTSKVGCHFTFMLNVLSPSSAHSPGSDIVTNGTEVKRWQGSLTAAVASVIAAIGLMSPDSVRVLV